MVDEPLKDAVVVQQLIAGFVVHLVPDHRRVTAVPGDHLTDHPFGVEPERRMGEVHLLPGAPRDPAAGRPLRRDLRIPTGEPRRHRVRRRTEHHGDAPLVCAVQDRSQPVQMEQAVFGLPGGPHRLPDPDHREARVGHQVQIGLQQLGCLILVVVRGAEQDTPIGHCLTPPAPRPLCQNRCSIKKRRP